MARLPKITQKVECTIPGYEDIYVRVWVNAPQRVFDDWLNMKAESIVHGDDDRPAFETDPVTGEVALDEEFKPVLKVDTSKALDASRFFLTTLITEFSLDEDMDGKPLTLADDDFMERVPQDLIRWLFDAVTDAVNDRRATGKESVRLAEIIGQRYEQA